MSSKEYYLQTCRNLFAGILDWSDAQTTAWLERTRVTSGLDDPDGAVYHSTPQYWAAGAILQAHLRLPVPDDDWQRLLSEVTDVLERGGDLGFLPPDTDWHPYRARVR